MAAERLPWTSAPLPTLAVDGRFSANLPESLDALRCIRSLCRAPCLDGGRPSRWAGYVVVQAGLPSVHLDWMPTSSGAAGSNARLSCSLRSVVKWLSYTGHGDRLVAGGTHLFNNPQQACVLLRRAFQVLHRGIPLRPPSQARRPGGANTRTHQLRNHCSLSWCCSPRLVVEWLPDAFHRDRMETHPIQLPVYALDLASELRMQVGGARRRERRDGMAQPGVSRSRGDTL